MAQALTSTAQAYFQSGPALVNTLGGSSGFGEDALPVDSYSVTIDLRPIFGPNGIIVAGRQVLSLTIVEDGRIYFYGEDAIFNISVNNFDVRNGYTAGTSPGGNSQGTGRIHIDRDPTNSVLTITWDDVGHPGQPLSPEAFQLQIVKLDDGGTSFLFRYEQFDHVSGGPFAQINVGSGAKGFHLFPDVGPGEFDTATGNTGVTGLWAANMTSPDFFGEIPYSKTIAEDTALSFTEADFPDHHYGFEIEIVEVPSNGSLRLNHVPVQVGQRINTYELSSLTYVPIENGNGSSFDQFTIRENPDDEWHSPEYTFTINVTPVNDTAVLDLNGGDAGTGFASSYTEGGAAAASSDTDVLITDVDTGDDIVSATIAITNPETGDKLNVGTLPATVTVDGTSTDTVVKLVATSGTSKADFEAAIEAITFSNTGDNPTDFGTNVSRSITVVVNDGTANSNVATATVAVTDVNDGPDGTSATITAVEDAHRVLAAADFGFTDVDGTLASVTISGVTGGAIYFDADGAGGADPVAATPPQTYTAQQLADGKVSFKAEANANGSGLGTITFAVTDDDGATDASTNTLTVDVTPQNDRPDIPNSPTINAIEQTPITVNAAITVSDIDRDALNGGAGDYSGAASATNRNASSPDDVFAFDTTGATFTVNGSNLEVGGVVVATLAQSDGILNINFVNNGTVPTRATVNDVLQHLQYTNTSNDPPASVTLIYVIDDGAPGSGQGAVTSSNNIDGGQVVVNLAGVNDAPSVDLNGAAASQDNSAAYSEQDPPAALGPDLELVDPDDTMLEGATVAIGTGFITGADVLTIGGLVSGATGTAGAITFSYNGATGVMILTGTASLADYQAALRAVSFSSSSNTPGTSRAISWKVNDGTVDSNLPTTTVNVTAVEDSAIANDDTDSTGENATKVITVLTNDGDVDGPPPAVTQINGTPVSAGDTVTLASGAKATLNADGTITYNPNGKFTTLTDNSSGAANTSAPDSFTYTVTGGDTATVNVTVNGVAGPGDRLRGNAGNNVINGGSGVDVIDLRDGGQDRADGSTGNDGFFMGGALSAGDYVDGGAGANDQLILQGDYAALTTLGADVLRNVEVLSLLSSTETMFGAASATLYDYNLKTVDENVAAGQRLVVDFTNLVAGEDVTFDGSAETDGGFTFGGGLGIDTLTGGAGADLFLFRDGGRYGAGDTVDGGAGIDELALRGNYTGATAIAFQANTMVNIEVLSILSGHSTWWGPIAGDFDYDLTMHDNNVAAGQRLVVDAGQLKAGETLEFDGSAETDGYFLIAGGAAADTITGGAGNDTLIGGLGADALAGGAGADTFRYRTTEESTGAAFDHVTDFRGGTDKIDLSRIDADTLTAGDQAFTWIGSNAFAGEAGQLRAYQNGGSWFVEGDTDGDGDADLVIQLTLDGPSPLVQGDFIP